MLVAECLRNQNLSLGDVDAAFKEANYQAKTKRQNAVKKGPERCKTLVQRCLKTLKTAFRYHQAHTERFL